MNRSSLGNSVGPRVFQLYNFLISSYFCYFVLKLTFGRCIIYNYFIDFECCSLRDSEKYFQLNIKLYYTSNKHFSCYGNYNMQRKHTARHSHIPSFWCFSHNLFCVIHCYISDTNNVL